MPDAKLVLSQLDLNLVHPRGGLKAHFFLARGFRLEEPDVMRQALLAHARVVDFEERPDPLGFHYVGVVVYVEPDGRGYMLEFFNATGDTLAVESFLTDEVAPLRPDQILHVRSLAAA